MPLFNFFKPKHNSEPKSFDEIIELASRDVAYRPLFYRTLLETDIYILIDPDENLPKGKFITTEATALRIRRYGDGTIPIFTSLEKIYDNNVIKEQAHYVAMKGKDLFNVFEKPPRFFLNPYSLPAKELLPEEIENLRKGEFYEAGEKGIIEKGSTIQIGMPVNYPHELVSALKKYCTTREEIKEMYLALMHNLDKQERPHLLIGVKAFENLKEIFDEIGEIIKHHISEGEFVDIIDLSGKDGSKVWSKGYRIY